MIKNVFIIIFYFIFMYIYVKGNCKIIEIIVFFDDVLNIFVY